MDESSPAKVAALIPEVYYDLIARVPAGTFFLVALLVLYRPTVYKSFAGARIETGAVLLLMFIVAIAGYSAGLLLSALGNLISWLFWDRTFSDANEKYENIVVRIEARLGIDPLQARSSRKKVRNHNDCIYRRLHEYLKEVDVQAKVVLPKMQAEAALCCNFAAGVLIVFVASVIELKHVSSLGLLWTAVALALSVTGARFRSRRVIERHFSYFAQLVRPDEKAMAAGRG
jgi:hypothetical protein